MAIAFRSAGTAVAHDVGTGNPVSVPTPAGFAAGDFLLMVLTQDSNTLETAPAGWTLAGRFAAGTSGYYAAPATAVYWKAASGSEGSSVAVNYNTSNWPVGDPYVVGFMLSYTGVNTASPVEVMSGATLDGNSSPAATETHPQVTVANSGDWLLTLRTGSANNVFTATCSVGTDVQRQIATGFNELTTALFDSNTALSTGVQTQRSTTLSGTPFEGTGMATLLIIPASTPTAVTARPATVSGTAVKAFAPTVTLGSSPWNSVCGPAQYPTYCWAIDWALSGMTAAGKILSTNPYLDSQDTTGWAGNNATVTYARTPLGLRTLPTLHVVPNGVSAAGGVNATVQTGNNTVVAGNSYVADFWVYSPGGVPALSTAVDWYTNVPGFVSTGTGATVTVPAGVWTHVKQTLVAPATATQGLVRARHSGTPASSQDYYVWGLRLMDPTRAESRITPDATAVVQADLLSGGITLQYGRDQSRPLSPPSLGTMSFSVTNKDRVFSPEFQAGPLYGTQDAARPVRGQVVWNGQTYNLFSGYINDYTIHVDRGDRSVDFSFQDAMSRMQNTQLTTQLFRGMRTGAAINKILDLINWPGGRDIDPGDTIMPFWWLEQTTVTTALQDLILSEGHPAIAYADPGGTFVFRSRTHRLLRPQSTNRQATFTGGQMTVCPPAAAPGLSFTSPFSYAHGWRDIANYVVFNISQRAPAPGPAAMVWQNAGAIQLPANQPVQITATTTDPFLSAVTPSQAAGDFTVVGAGTVTASISQTSGQSTVITLLATGGAAAVNNLTLRAVNFPVVQTTVVTQSDTNSILQHGQQAYPNQLAWAGVQDAQSIAQIILLRYAQKRPSIQLSVPNADQTHYAQMLQRTVSDLVHVQFDEMGMNADFFVENVAHSIERMNEAGLPPAHTVTLGCEMQVSGAPPVPFMFDTRGQGFDNGQFNPPSSDAPTTVWIWDNPAQSVFDVSLFAT
jgi:hypothetical protein